MAPPAKRVVQGSPLHYKSAEATARRGTSIEVAMGESIKIGVSSCLLGENVRYDGGHKRDPYIVEVLARFFELVPVCPEFECGLGVPREAMRLEGDPAAPRLMTHRTRVDLTDRMSAFCQRRVAALAREQLCGFVFKSRSPCCGLHRLSVFGKARCRRNGRGVFVAALLQRLPQLPVVDEQALADTRRRDRFVADVRSWTMRVSQR